MTTKGERRLRAIFKRWIPLLGLSNWDISIELAPDLPDTTDGIEAAADCHASWQYERAVIRFSLHTVNEDTDAQLERHVVHELMHCLLAELRETHKMSNEERTAVMLTRAFVRAVA